MIGMDRDCANLLRFGSNHAAAHWQLLLWLRQDNGCRLVDRLLLAGDQPFALSAFVHPFGDELVRLRIFASCRGHNLVWSRICLDDRRRLRRTGRTKQCAITEGAGRADHGQRKHAGDRHNAQAPPGRWDILVVFLVGLLSDVVIIGVLRIIGLTWRVAASLVVGRIDILIRRWRAPVGLAPIPLNSMLTLRCVELLRGRRARGVITIAGGSLRQHARARIGRSLRRIARSQWLRVPVGTLFGRGGGCPTRGLAAEFSKGIGLPNKACELRKRIGASAFGRSAHGWFTCAIRSLELVVRH